MPDDPLTDKVPPHSLEAEMAVLGSMMLDPDTIGLCLQVLDVDCFWRAENRTVFETLVRLYDESKPIEFPAVRQALADAGHLEEIGGEDYLVTLHDSVVSTASAEYYATVVKEKALLRGLLHAASEILRDAHRQDEAVDDVLDRSEQRIFEITERKLVGQAADVRAILSDLMQKLDLVGGHAVTGLETGFYELDDMTRGLQAGEMIVLAARPSVGKSALALNIAEHVAVDLEKGVAFFSLEMSRQELALRLLASRARVDGQRLRKGTLSRTDAKKVVEDVAPRLYEVPLYIDDTPGLRVIDLRAKARRLKARHDVELIIVDYLQLMTSPGAENRQVEVANISRGLKALARELGVPMLAVSQLRRESETRGRPRLSDLRESGAIEQDADVVLLLHRPEVGMDAKKAEAEQLRGRASLIIAKQRNGPVGTVRLTWLREQTRFESYSFREAGGPGDFEQVGAGPAEAGDQDEVPAPF